MRLLLSWSVSTYGTYAAWFAPYPSEDTCRVALKDLNLLMEAGQYPNVQFEFEAPFDSHHSSHFRLTGTGNKHEINDGLIVQVLEVFSAVFDEITEIRFEAIPGHETEIYQLDGSHRTLVPAYANAVRHPATGRTFPTKARDKGIDDKPRYGSTGKMYLGDIVTHTTENPDGSTAQYSADGSCLVTNADFTSYHC